MPPRPPKTHQLGVQDGPRATQKAPKTLQEPPKSCQRGGQEADQRCIGARDRPRAAQEPPRPPPALDFGSFCWRICTIFGRFFALPPLHRHLSMFTSIRIQFINWIYSSQAFNLRGRRNGRSLFRSARPPWWVMGVFRTGVESAFLKNSSSHPSEEGFTVLHTYRPRYCSRLKLYLAVIHPRPSLMLSRAIPLKAFKIIPGQRNYNLKVLRRPEQQSGEAGELENKGCEEAGAAVRWGQSSNPVSWSHEKLWKNYEN